MKKLDVSLLVLFVWAFSSSASAESEWYETVHDTALHESPTNSSRVVTTAKKGTALHSTDAEHGEWVELYEMADNASKAEQGNQAYIYRLFNLPGTNVFALKRDLRPVPSHSSGQSAAPDAAQAQPSRMDSGTTSPGAVGEPAFRASLQGWERYYGKMIGNIASLPPEKADEAFFRNGTETDFCDELQSSEALDKLQASVGPLLSRWAESRKQGRLAPADRDVLALLQQHGLRPEFGEGTPFLQVDNAFFVKKLKGNFSPDLRACLDLAETQPSSFFSDGGCRYSVVEMGNWAVQWERFLAEHPGNARRADVERRYEFFMDFILFSTLDNTPAFPRSNKRKMKSEWQASLRTVAERNSGTRTAALIEAYLAAIQKDGFQLSGKNKKIFRNRMQQLCRDIR